MGCHSLLASWRSQGARRQQLAAPARSSGQPSAYPTIFTLLRDLGFPMRTAGISALRRAVGLGLPVRPFLRHDYLEVTAIVRALTSSDETSLTSEKAVAALRGYAHVVANSRVFAVQVRDVRQHKSIRLRLYYKPFGKAEFVLSKSLSDTVTHILRDTFGNRLDALRS